ncbi:MAG: type 1 glutamine amidotransferase [Syntrophobacteraceae bacterium]|nr:type 1 glutamine amidotransferase [Syntrophobacteraceae bacterium]
MKLHYLQHVPFEGPANVGDWAQNQGWDLSATHLYRGENLPATSEFDWLVVMGGPMNIYEEDRYPFLAAEKKFIQKAIEANKLVLGICLGAQLIADVLGGSVTRNRHKEIGWFPVSLRPEGMESAVFTSFPPEFAALHWHGDTFSLPPGAAMVAQSTACPAQAFTYNGGRVVALQFHLESSPDSVRLLIENCSDELVEGEFIQKADAILEKRENFSSIHYSMRTLLENMKKIQTASIRKSPFLLH